MAGERFVNRKTDVKTGRYTESGELIACSPAMAQNCDRSHLFRENPAHLPSEGWRESENRPSRMTLSLHGEYRGELLSALRFLNKIDLPTRRRRAG